MQTFRSTSIQLTAAILGEVPEATFTGFEDDSIERNRKIILISYPESTTSEVTKVIKEFDDKSLAVNLFYYNRNLNFLRDKLFSRRMGR